MITVNGSPHPWHEGMTVLAVLEERRYTFPLLVVRLDGRLVSRAEYAETRVPDGSDVDVMHLMSGG